MTAIVNSLRSVLRATRQLRAQAEREPLAAITWLPVQLRYFRSRHLRRLFRAGNQSVGKTWAGLADLIWDAEGRHPYRPNSPLPPGQDHREFWLVCAAWGQSVAIQRKLYSLLSKDRLHPGTIYTRARGFRGKNPFVEIRHEDGSYSVIRIKTTRQGTLDLAGDSISGALFDEVPVSQDVYTEVCKRTQTTGGWVSICATMVGAPVDWLREMAETPFEDGTKQIDDIHTRLTPDALIPVGSRRPIRLPPTPEHPNGQVCDAAWIKRQEEETPPHEREVRVHGGWEIRYTDRVFDIFVSDESVDGTHVHKRVPRGPRVKYLVGVDFGTKPGKQVAYLIVVEERPDGPPAVYVFDEYQDPTGRATPRDDAKGILAMLERNGLTWRHIDWCGTDIDHLKGSAKAKSARDLQVQIAKQLGVPPDSLHPPCWPAKRGAGNYKDGPRIGERWLRHRMLRPHEFGVHPRCKRLIKAFNEYMGGHREDAKDPIDALRYGLDNYIFDRRRATRQREVYVV